MKSFKRLFIGIPVPQNRILLDFVGEMQRTFIQSRIKWVPSGNWHFTLRFLGDTPVRAISPIVEMMQRNLSSLPAFKGRIAGIGVFKSLREPKVLWCGIYPAEPFQDIYKRISPVAAITGSPAVKERFTPHLTLGRIKWLHDMELFRHWIEKYEYNPFFSFHVHNVVLYESVLKSSGPVYHIVEKISLHKLSST
ncbi:MAG: RNA 2',3'-cyclic phosphodiesterase [Chlorobi bacterium]|nr:RNA 2',3'-cyclic phosphodiesterase [Chlorobiota bacterium]